MGAAAVVEIDVPRPAMRRAEERHELPGSGTDGEIPSECALLAFWTGVRRVAVESILSFSDCLE